MLDMTTVPPAHVTNACRSICFRSLLNNTNLKRMSSADALESALESFGRLNVLILNLARSNICSGHAVTKYFRRKVASIHLARVYSRILDPARRTLVSTAEQAQNFRRDFQICRLLIS